MTADLDVTEDQAALREVVRTYARRELAPTYLERARTARFPWAEHRRVAELGVLGLLADEGGGGVEKKTGGG